MFDRGALGTPSVPSTGYCVRGHIPPGYLARDDSVANLDLIRVLPENDLDHENVELKRPEKVPEASADPWAPNYQRYLCGVESRVYRKPGYSGEAVLGVVPSHYVVGTSNMGHEAACRSEEG